MRYLPLFDHTVLDVTCTCWRHFCVIVLVFEKLVIITIIKLSLSLSCLLTSFACLLFCVVMFDHNGIKIFQIFNLGAVLPT